MLNLISDPWIPVRLSDGTTDTIAPHDLARDDVVFPDWPRPDLNLACLELMIGLVYLADPPTSRRDRNERQLTPDQLRTKMQHLIPAFNLMGDGPLFMQEYGGFDGGSMNDPAMLFIDNAGASTIKKNADLMVHDGRYGPLSLPMAAMALYTMQSFAPAGGAGNRTSMRGGGPLVTLVYPQTGRLRDLIWVNTPIGEPLQDLAKLPWMHPFSQTDKDAEYHDPRDSEFPNPEVFFGMPRRITLMFNDGQLTAVNQTPWGYNYVGWQHPLSPYYMLKDELLPKHPTPGPFTYARWQGIVVPKDDGQLAQCVRDLGRKAGDSMLIGGWAMSNMTPTDFLWAEAPLLDLEEPAQKQVIRLIKAGVDVAAVLGISVARALNEEKTTGVANSVRDDFYFRTEQSLIIAIDDLRKGVEFDAIAANWLKHLSQVSVKLFDAIAFDRISSVGPKAQEEIVSARRKLTFAISGYGKDGSTLFDHLGMVPPKSKKEKA